MIGKKIYQNDGRVIMSIALDVDFDSLLLKFVM